MRGEKEKKPERRLRQGQQHSAGHTGERGVLEAGEESTGSSGSNACMSAVGRVIIWVS